MIPDLENVRKVIDDLHKHQEMSDENRADMEDALCELERSAKFASKVRDSISVAQKDLIQEVLSPYIPAIKAETYNGESAKEWVICAFNPLKACGPDQCKIKLAYILVSYCSANNSRSL